MLSTYPKKHIAYYSMKHHNKKNKPFVKVCKEKNMERMRIISKEGRKWKILHSDGQITYHKSLKAAKAYKHTLVVFDPFPETPSENLGPSQKTLKENRNV